MSERHTNMCKICETILGVSVIKHSEKECPLAASAYCSICVSYGHFQDNCANKPCSISITSIPPVKSEGVNTNYANTLYLADREPVHRAYLSSNGNVIYGKVSKNKAICEGIAKSLGYESIKWVHGSAKAKKTSKK